MTVKERLHLLIEALPASEEQTVERILEALSATADPVRLAHEGAPLDDEPDNDDDDGGLTEARAEMARGEVYTMEEVKREFGP